MFLDDAALKAPSLALENPRREIHRVGTITFGMMGDLEGALAQRSKAKLDEVARRDDEVH